MELDDLIKNLFRKELDGRLYYVDVSCILDQGSLGGRSPDQAVIKKEGVDVYTLKGFAILAEVFVFIVFTFDFDAESESFVRITSKEKN